MKLIYERSVPGRESAILPASALPFGGISAGMKREKPLRLPELSEVDVCRHYTALNKQVYGVNCGFYPLGSCTMKYNPAVNEEVAALPGFQNIHPLQPEETVQGCLEVLEALGSRLCELVGMDAMTFQPAAGAHGEFTGLLLIKAYLRDNGGAARNKIIVPDSAHGTNPASTSMTGFQIVNIPSAQDGSVDLDALRAAVGPDTAGLMLTNPNTLGMFDKNILEITRIVHEAGGLCYYDGANMNAIMGTARPGDMGFDVIHLNLHKTFSTPHGGGGPGAAAVGAKEILAKYLPGRSAVKTETGYAFKDDPASIGAVRSFYGNFLVCVRALCYVLSLGGKGLHEASQNAVLNANYLRVLLKKHCPTSNEGLCMHEFVLTLEELHKETGVSASDLAKGMLDCGMHPPTMYFPLIVHEALMFEPTETETKDTLDEAAEAVISLLKEARSNPEALHSAPVTTPIGRPDEVAAARTPIIRCALD
ncbi:aminomethyl-transferring glycine dehydrogenase subunit GcvPB [Cloacibacillus evryensis]|uniref:aminomethyl-transferring glycine dehydrogenase subunit GcvPB n=1 Tax=Cloacibacillus evryensis TaxID=508460 RepID=UPI000451AD8E|nr:aminomethyl-transferring glycine dehydrogenase subunit GcvPB [Cloacibacillus evryensis]EXG78927.1 glycine cleavage system protein P [Cloacibacillus evryensis DSM 19522]MEA5036203.1 aminomethyl-transferring glycine dehydrogenase subunit GcvPB [Cloacibacillus evryensis]